MSTVYDRFQQIRCRVDTAAQETGKKPEDIMLLPVSKTFPAEKIAELYQNGIRDFGENRINELAEKAAQLPSNIIWHFIGRLQSNKVRKVVQLCSVIHSVDSIELLERINRIAGEENKHPRILLEVSVSGEESKGGISPDALPALADAAAQCANITFDGFMTMAPLDASDTCTAALFEKLRQLRDETAARLQLKLPTLSMGMSGDFETAVRHGSTLVRIGTAIFGER